MLIKFFRSVLHSTSLKSHQDYLNLNEIHEFRNKFTNLLGIAGREGFTGEEQQADGTTETCKLSFKMFCQETLTKNAFTMQTAYN
jgi:hypothetical protein